MPMNRMRARRMASFEGFGQGDARKDVPAGAAAGDDHGRRPYGGIQGPRGSLHRAAPMFIKTPTAAMLISSEVPP